MLTVIIYRMDTQQGPNEEYEKECVCVYIYVELNHFGV